MLNLKKLKIIICSLFIFLIIAMPMGNALAEELDFSLLLLSSPFSWPTASILGISKIFGFDPGINILGAPNAIIGNAIAKAIGAIMFSGGSILMILGNGILTTVVDSASTWLSPTDFTANPLVGEGWKIVRNVANAALIIGLVIIAINIILGREENKAKKTLVNFIIIALLINFTPVICGLIIDGSNVLTKSFVTGGINATTLINDSLAGFGNVLTGLSGDGLNILIVSFIFLAFAFTLFFICMLYALLFLGRSVILWILVIVSPIAFATKVFPQSKYIKKIFPSVLYWDEWWESFAQWCIIGIPAGMSIYLANMLIPSIKFDIATGSIDVVLGSLINTIVQCLTPFILLIAGFFISISAGGQVGSAIGGIATGAWAMSGGKVMSGLKEKVKGGGEWMIEGGKRTAAGIAIGGLSGIEQGVSGAKGKGVASELKGAVVGGYKGFIGGAGVEGRQKAAETIAKTKEIVGWTRRGTYAAEQRKEIEESKNNVKNLTKEEREKISLNPAITKRGEADRIASFEEAIKNNELTDAQLKYLESNKDWAKTFGLNLKDVAKNRPDLAPKLIDAIPGKPTTDFSAINGIIQGMNDKKAGTTINSQSYLNVDVMCSVGATNPRILDGKLKSGNGKDMENIKQGFVNVINDLVPGIGGSINTNNLQEFVDDDMNNQAINDAIETLEKSSNKDDNIKALGLKNLANYALVGKFNPPESNIKKIP